MYYDKHGRVKAAGAEAEASSIVSSAEDEGWIKAELFKLRLRPRTMKLEMNGMRLAPLPYRKTAVHVFGDFLSYLYQCTRTFIVDTHANGNALWKAVEHDIQFVLSHPNGWEGAQQTKMRRAAVYGQLIPDTNEGKARIRFVTEGEASLHACVLNGLASDVLSDSGQAGFLVADAGGGTFDLSSYTILAQHPLVIEEIAPPDCIFAGSVFVSRRAREFLKEKLKNSKYGSPDSLDHITKRFDETTKRLFRDKDGSQFIPFGSPLDKDLAVGIRNGQLKLKGEEVAALFEPSIQAAVEAIMKQIVASKGLIKSVFLVGGYAASSWLFTQLQERLAHVKVAVSRPDTQTSKAVADGAIGFYCDHHVSARIAKFMYGVEYLRAYNADNPDHVGRKDRLTELPSGPKLLADAFDCILARGVKVKESTVFSRKYCTELTNLSMLSVFEVEIWCYRGGDVIPQWIQRHADNFSTLCLVRADLSPLSGIVQSKMSKDGKEYWTIVFSIEIHFGLTEFKARIKWVDNGTIKYGPASIIYNERGHRAEEEESDTNPDDDMTVDAQSERQRSMPGSRTQTPDLRRSPTDSFASSRSSHTGHSNRESVYPAIPEVVPDRSISRSRGDEDRSRGLDTSRSLNGSVREKDRGRKKDKGKERARDIDAATEVSSIHSSSALAEALSSVWGSGGSPMKSPLSMKGGKSRLASVAGTPSVRGAELPPDGGSLNADVPQSAPHSAPSLPDVYGFSIEPPASLPPANNQIDNARSVSRAASVAASPKKSGAATPMAAESHSTPPASSEPAAPAPVETLLKPMSPVIAPLSSPLVLNHESNPWTGVGGAQDVGTSNLPEETSVLFSTEPPASGSDLSRSLGGSKTPKAATPKIGSTPKRGPLSLAALASQVLRNSGGNKAQSASKPASPHAGSSSSPIIAQDAEISVPPQAETSTLPLEPIPATASPQIVAAKSVASSPTAPLSTAHSPRQEPTEPLAEASAPPTDLPAASSPKGTTEADEIPPEALSSAVPVASTSAAPSKPSSPKPEIQSKVLESSVEPLMAEESVEAEPAGEPVSEPPAPMEAEPTTVASAEQESPAQAAAQPTPAAPAESTTVGPAEPTTVEPAETTTVEPAEPTTVEPAEPTTGEPATGEAAATETAHPTEAEATSPDPVVAETNSAEPETPVTDTAAAEEAPAADLPKSPAPKTPLKLDTTSIPPTTGPSSPADAANASFTEAGTTDKDDEIKGDETKDEEPEELTQNQGGKKKKNRNKKKGKK